MILKEEHTGGTSKLLIESSSVVQVIYLHPKLLMYVVFKNRRCYEYLPVTEALYNGLRSATSQGSYLSREIIKNRQIQCRRAFTLNDEEWAELQTDLEQARE